MEQENQQIIDSWRDFLDLNVLLSIELGRTRMQVRDILDLESASVIRLTRSTGEGVDVRADNRSLMRGEIIVIEDHAGVRINDFTKEEDK